MLALMTASSTGDADHIEEFGSAGVVWKFEFPAKYLGGGTDRSISSSDSAPRFGDDVGWGIPFVIVSVSLLTTVDVFEVDEVEVGFEGRPLRGLDASSTPSLR